jgi:hypothetical protein
MTFQWEVRPPGAPGFVALAEGDNAGVAEVSGVTTPTLTVARAHDTGATFRCVVSNSCAPAPIGVASPAATLTLCRADFNCDDSTDFFDYDDFVACFETLGCPEADFNHDGSIDFFDYDDFVAAFGAGC